MPDKNRLPVMKDAKSSKLILHKTKSAAVEGDLFERVVGILEQARAGVVRAVNSHMVLAYWLIGREIVQEIQGGEGRAAYGKQVLRELSRKLGERYGRGFSVTNLQYLRQFHQVYNERILVIRQTASGESVQPPASSIHQTASGELANTCHRDLSTVGVLDDLLLATKTTGEARGFSPLLGWSHYQELMQVENRNERLFYEIETEKEGWDVRHLRRQIHTLLFARLLKSRNKAGVMKLARQGQTLEKPADALKHPYIYLTAGDNPSIGLILCAEKNETVAKYSVLNDCKQIFASKYMLYLPTEQELSREIERERRHLEEQTKSRSPEPKRREKASP